MMDFSMSRPPGRTYRYFSGTPQFCFGHGLNPLTTFTLSKLEMRQTKSKVKIWTSITNAGSRTASEVVLAFFEPPSDIPASEPASKLRRQLFGFERIHLEPQESTDVALEVSSSTFLLSDADGLPQVFAGEYKITFSAGSMNVEMAISVDDEFKVGVPIVTNVKSE